MTPRLDVAKVIAGAFLVPWWHRRAFVRALAIPLPVLVGYSFLWYQVAAPRLPEQASWFIFVLHGFPVTLFMVTCHRLVLLDADVVANRWAPVWSWRETHFYLWIVLSYFSILAGALFLFVTVGEIWRWLGAKSSVWIWTDWGPSLLLLLAAYIFCRLCLVFPAIAVDRRPNLRWAWKRSRNNGWRLMIVVVGLHFTLSSAMALAHRGEATGVERFILMVTAVALFTVEVAALSLCYRELTRDDAGPLGGGASS